MIDLHHPRKVFQLSERTGKAFFGMLTGEEPLRDRKIVDYLFRRQRRTGRWLARAERISSVGLGQDKTTRAGTQRFAGAFGKHLFYELRIADGKVSPDRNRVNPPDPLLQFHGYA